MKETEICLTCNGSGEGRGDGSTCVECKGLGEVELYRNGADAYLPDGTGIEFKTLSKSYINLTPRQLDLYRKRIREYLYTK